MLEIALEWWILYVLIIVISSTLCSRAGKPVVLPGETTEHIDAIVWKLDELLSEVSEIRSDVDRSADHVAPLPSVFDD